MAALVIPRGIRTGNVQRRRAQYGGLDMTYFVFEFRNNSKTRGDHVVALLSYSFGMPTCEAFEIAMRVHNSGQEIAAVCEDDLLDRIQGRLEESNAKISHPVDYVFYPVQTIAGHYLVTSRHLNSARDFDQFLAKETRLNVEFLMLCVCLALVVALMVFL
ncbi:ATP-dependent Clp protease adaptor ClpS [Roseovarius sp. MMSF_3359]|uniref:ATP-dependent Clp protease adaptor ClpS n=2 Tax=unclassified Roseovarius TaxID=2614913 RepID=UPI00273FBF61|nr:ATP-dependent Clp protease adaptor ClpS [Roseovarius sp. MMSF_3359]